MRLLAHLGAAFERRTVGIVIFVLYFRGRSFAVLFCVVVQQFLFLFFFNLF